MTMLQQQRIIPLNVEIIITICTVISFLSFKISCSFAFNLNPLTSLTLTQNIINTQRGSESYQHQPIFLSTRTNGIIDIESNTDVIDYSFLSDDILNCTKEDLLNREQLDYITKLVDKRSSARSNGDYTLADSIRDEINALESIPIPIIPNGYVVEIQDIPRKQGGGSTWRLQLVNREPIDWINVKQDDDGNANDNYNEKNDNGESVLKIAHAALGLASWSSENNTPVDQDHLQNLVVQAKRRLRKTGSRELRGRKAADAAFWFAMAGVNDDVNSSVSANDNDDDNSNGVSEELKFDLFDALTYVCIEEIKRFGMRSSCRITDIMHMVERIAASGVRSEMFSLLQQEAAKCLKSKGGNSTSSDIDLVQNGVLDALEQGDFELHSERPLLWIWRFSTRQRKQQAFLRSASKHWEMSDDNNNAERNKNVGTNVNTRGMISKWDSIFDDPTLPLVLDIGCGMGISVLGLASCTHSKDDNSPHFEYENSVLDLEWSTCNFLGADLSQLAINYASSVSRRWDLKGRVQFEVVSAEEIIENIIATYPGPVKLAMIQFPTPFSFQQDESGENNKEEVLNSVVNQGNKQLPSSAYSGFMVTKVLLDLIYSAVEGSGGKLLLQSNCEDVAVLMKNIAVKEAGFQTVDVKNHTSHLNDKKTGLTKRTEKWIAMGGERAEGSCWSSTHILPIRGSTETETACVLNGTPVHRCVLEVPKNK